MARTSETKQNTKSYASNASNSKKTSKKPCDCDKTKTTKSYDSKSYK